MATRTAWAFILLCTLGLLCIQPVHAQERAVAVVYDDSGSMKDGGRWWYANYAYQTLLALLDEKDTLRLVTMSEPETTYEFDLANRRRLIQGMYNQSAPGAPTPYASITTAVDALKNVSADHKWLVVISDGTFEIPSSVSLKDQIGDFRSTVGGQVIFLVIGTSQANANELGQQRAVQAWASHAQATVYTAASPPDIIKQLQQIAADVTSRTLGAVPGARANGAEIQLTSEFPLRRLTLLEQQPSDSSALHAVQSAEVNGTSLSELTQLDAKMPNKSEETLFGRVTHVERPQDEVIPSGTITVTLDRPASLEDFKILPEVAARLRTSLTASSGATISKDGDVYEPCFGDTVQLQATLITPSGDTLLQQVQNPEKIDVTATKGAQNVSLSPSSSGKTFEHTFTMPEDTLTVSVAARYPGYFNFKSNLYTLRGYECQPARALSTAPIEPWSADVTDVPDQSPLRIEPRADGTSISPEEFERWSLDVVDSPGTLNLAVERGSAGAAWTMRPTLTWGFPQMTPTGSFSATVELSSPRPNESPIRRTVQFNIRDVSFWALWGGLILLILALLLLSIYIWGLIRKPRFPSGSEIHYREDNGYEQRYKLPTKGPWRWMIPFTAEENDAGFEPLRFRATRGSAILLPEGQQNDSMRIGPRPLRDPGVQDEYVDPGTTVTYRDGQRKREYTYVTR